MRPVLALIASVLFAQGLAAKTFESPEILILGDSQLPFGSGPVFVDFFSDLVSSCQPDAMQRIELQKLEQSRVAAIGVRSTSLPTWLTRSGKAKSALCDVDPK